MDQPQQSDRQKRILVRIPTGIPAAIYIRDTLLKKIIITDLSTKGISFFIHQSEAIPDIFEVIFRLRPFTRLIKVKVGVRNRITCSQGLRLGCVFLEISQKDQRRMNKYICRIVNMFLPVALVNLAAFFCAVDACWRLLLYSVNLYYSRTGFGKGIFGYSLPDSYGIVLLAYAFFAFAAFIFSARVLGKRGKLYFLFSLFFQGFAFIFILTKNIIYWKMGLWDFSQIFVNVFFGIQVFLVSYVGLAILFGIFSIKMVQRTLEIINQQLLSLEKF